MCLPSKTRILVTLRNRPLKGREGCWREQIFRTGLPLEPGCCLAPWSNTPAGPALRVPPWERGAVSCAPPPYPTPCPWKSHLWNWSVVPKRLGTAGLYYSHFADEETKREVNIFRIIHMVKVSIWITTLCFPSLTCIYNVLIPLSEEDTRGKTT